MEKLNKNEKSRKRPKVIWDKVGWTNFELKLEVWDHFSKSEVQGYFGNFDHSVALL